MIKFKGKEIPVSIVKFYLADSKAEKLEFIKNHLKCDNYTTVYNALIDFSYGLFKQHADYLKQEEIDKSLEESIIEDKKDA